ncbi:hypothetical protein RhiirA1_457553 [Rhizophagus irregularis]|uniref:Ion transport domain-containing protein n=2 Tax=Rhizophagus irregularis TaxID=588596 RepID=A0A2N0RXT5_9GLOM|nr:hypothetical protein RhiirA1_457553 [Rhizophagus irregularis]
MSTYTDHIEVQIPSHIQDDKVHIHSHNEKPITMMTISLKSEYIVTYSKEDESFEGWSRNPSSESSGPFTLDDEYRELKNMDVLDFKVSDNKIIITKGVSVEEFIFDMKNKKKIILDIYEDDPEFVNFPDDYEVTNFLTNGDIIIYQNYHQNPVVIKYSNNNINWERKVKYEMNFCDEKINKMNIIFGGVVNDRLYFLINNYIHLLDILDIILDLPKFRYRKIPFEINEKEIEKLKEEFEELTLKISESLMVIKFGDIFYIYSNEMNVPIGKIIVKEPQDFDIIHDDNDNYYIATLNDKYDDDNHKESDKINIRSWKSNLRKSINFNKFIHKKFNDNKAYGLYQNKPWIIDMKKMFNNNSDSENNLIISIKDSEQDNKNQKENSKDSVQDNTNQNNLDDNIFYRIKNLLDKDEKQLLTDDGRKLFKNQYTGDENQYTNWISKRKNEKQLIKKRKQTLKRQNKDIEKQDKNDNNTIEKQNNVEEYDLILIEKPSNKILGASGEAIEEIIIKVNEKISYNTKLSNNEYNNWILVNQKDKNTCILYNEYESELPELRIYIFNMEFKKIQLQHCYNIEFLTCAIKYYYNIKLDTLEIEIIAKHTENCSLKVQWIDYLLNNEYDFLVHYGEILLKSAIKLKNIELMEKIIKKTLEYFKKDLKRNIYILSIIFNNVPYLESNYVENLLKYYNETTLFRSSSFFLYRIKKIRKNESYNVVFYFHNTIFIINIPNLYKFIITFYRKSYNLKLLFVVPFPNYIKYSKDYNWFKEFFIMPKSSPFSKTENNEFYKTWNGEAIINFKWRVFASSVSSEIIKDNKRNLLISSIIFGSLHLFFEIRQFIWNPIKWIVNPWNWFDIGAYLLPTITSCYWIYNNDNNITIDENIMRPLFSISCLLLDIKFLLFFRVFESFGIYFAIIIGVGRRIFWFLFILFLIIISFAHAFFVLLKPNSEFSKNNQGDPNDDNNPWVLTPKLHSISKNGEDSNAIYVQEPDEYTNLFSNYPNSILSMYLFLTGDRNSLSRWEPEENRIMIILMIMFSFIVVVYLMNLFIGLLNMAIEKDNDRASYLAQKAEILKDIELFYLLPHQRRWNHWFPDIIYYYADVDKTRKAVKKLLDDGTWSTDDVKNIEMRKKLLKLLAITV